MRIALTGGIACGKSLVAQYLNELGVETLDADDVVHGLIPPEERRRLAKTVFADPAARKALEARIHPIVRQRIERFFDSSIRRQADCDGTNVTGGTNRPIGQSCNAIEKFKVAIIPLLFEVQWEKDFDIILCVTSSRVTQVARMMTTRGYSREEAEARLAAQLSVEEKAAKSHYAIANDGSAEELRRRVAEMVEWLKER